MTAAEALQEMQQGQQEMQQGQQQGQQQQGQQQQQMQQWGQQQHQQQHQLVEIEANDGPAMAVAAVPAEAIIAAQHQHQLYQQQEQQNQQQQQALQQQLHNNIQVPGVQARWVPASNTEGIQHIPLPLNAFPLGIGDVFKFLFQFNSPSTSSGFGPAFYYKVGTLLKEPVDKKLSFLEERSTITLTETMLKKLREVLVLYIDSVRRGQLADMRIDIGSGIFAQVNLDFGPKLDIRQFFEKNGEMFATKKGVRLSANEAVHLENAIYFLLFQA